jgi:hypothetical protein
VSGANRYDQLIDQWDLRLRKAFLDSIQNIRDLAQIEQIARMLEEGNIEGALRAVGLDPVSFRPLDKAIEQAFDAGGITTAKSVPPAIEAGGLRTIFQFNVRNPDAERWLKDHSSTLIKQILDDQRTMIRSTLTDAMSKGLNPRTAALDLVGRIGPSGAREGGMIGLTDSQAAWVRNYAEELASDDPIQALQRALRDKRFDRAVIRAVKDGKPIPQDLMDKMVTAYKNRALRYRAETIARSEAITSLHQAQEMSMQQAVASGTVAQDQVGFIWRAAHDSRTREAHRHLDGQFAKMGQPFQSDLGPIRFPGDPQATPANVINCRCFREPKIDFLKGIK